ncbi:MULTISPECIES: glycosyltransferase family 4 protein [Cyanophyceae]|uniref:glycosyltransferase family 4 protein n=1 Tax=Cyanophyceae TaxID=3028117 RepID=UPI001689224C|nr:MULTISPECIES: glycosyltransferase family 4 protein [Cyanophyceae]MBD1915363.1 glycosyltransferase [Phormidium sp. FACHB-77]MBD2028927.1 glycosyltransferase [Phormidium sp. FACHB-322]MBD2049375.1 glycosyltransferase [Leptolyngbya sp. FACHB-60]
MKILFLHPNFPAQFRHLATALAKNPNHEVVFGTMRQDGSLPGVRKAYYQPTRQAGADAHRYVRSLESAVLQGQAVYRMAQELKADGFYPHVVYAHSGWGPGLFIKDIFPKAKYVGYFEWFYHAHGSDADFDPADSLTADDEARIRIKNAPILLDLAACDAGVTPTQWQYQQFPPELQSKLTVIHDGIDTEYFRLKPGAKLVLPTLGLDLSHVNEVITYVARGMEPYRGFPQFMETVARLQQRRPHCHTVIVGEDRVAYGKSLPDGRTYKQKALEELDLDLSRIHFTGLLPYAQYRQVLQASSVHVYLTRPFVLSWSLLEVMATGCAVVASRTAPAEEVITDGTQGLLADFFSPEDIAAQVETILDCPDRAESMRAQARETVLARFDLAHCLSEQLAHLSA